MFDGVICADDLFLNAPKFRELLQSKSCGALAAINMLWGSKKNVSDSDFVNNVEDVFPSLVRQIHLQTNDGPVKQKRINMNPLVAILSKAVADQQDIINDQQLQMDEQQKQIDRLQSMVEKIMEDN